MLLDLMEDINVFLLCGPYVKCGISLFEENLCHVAAFIGN